MHSAVTIWTPFTQVLPRPFRVQQDRICSGKYYCWKDRGKWHQQSTCKLLYQYNINDIIHLVSGGISLKIKVWRKQRFLLTLVIVFKFEFPVNYIIVWFLFFYMLVPFYNKHDHVFTRVQQYFTCKIYMYCFNKHSHLK